MCLQLEDLVCVLWIFDLLSNLRRFLVHASLEEALSMVELVLGDVWVELCQLIVHVGSGAVVLDVEVAVSQEGEGSAVSG